MTVTDKKISKLNAVLEGIEKQYGKGTVVDGNNIIEVDRISSGSISLDIITGGGWGIGKMVELIGPESSGKTTVCIHSMVSAQQTYPDKKVLLVDAEHAFDRTYAEGLGLDMSKVLCVQPDNGEQGLDVLEKIISSGEVSLAVVDSIAALTPKAEIDGDMGESKMGLHARLMSQACRKLAGITNKTGTVIIWTNQLRDKIGVVYGNPEVTTGGNAMKFYASIRVDIRKSAGDKDADGQVINSKVKVKTIKNKLAPPFQNTEFDIVFGKGIDLASEVLAYSLVNDVIQKAGSWFSYGGTRLGQGAAAVKDMLQQNPELLDELETKVRELYNIPKH